MRGGNHRSKGVWHEAGANSVLFTSCFFFFFFFAVRYVEIHSLFFTLVELATNERGTMIAGAYLCVV